MRFASVLLGVLLGGECVSLGRATSTPLPWVRTYTPAGSNERAFAQVLSNGTLAHFIPRGANYIRVDGTRDDDEVVTVGRLPQLGYHSTFSPLYVNRTEWQEALGWMRQQGYNLVRVFIDGGTSTRRDGINGPHDNANNSATALGKEYMDNVAEFVADATAAEIYVMITLSAMGNVPGNLYWRTRAGPNPNKWGSPNVAVLDGDYVGAFAEFAAMFEGELGKRLPPGGLSGVFTISLANEAYMLDNVPPFSTNDTIQTADGHTYSMVNDTQRQQCMDANFVYWTDEVRKAIREVEGQQMVTLGQYTFMAVGKAGPNGLRMPTVCLDHRFPTRPAILSHSSSLDHLDQHIYPLQYGLNKLKWTFQDDIHSSEWELVDKTRMPVLMGEFGAFKRFFPTIPEATQAMAALQSDSCHVGFDAGNGGGLYWTLDIGNSSIWTLKEAPQLNQALAPVSHPNICRP